MVGRISSNSISGFFHQLSMDELANGEVAGRDDISLVPPLPISPLEGMESTLLRALTHNTRATLDCFLCNEHLTIPVSLPCGDNFCKECIENHLSKEDMCPFCSSPVPAYAKSNLGVNNYLKGFVEKTYSAVAVPAPAFVPPSPEEEVDGESTLLRAMTHNTRLSLECCICLSHLVDPVTLPCGDNFCMEHIKQHFERKNDCPLCRRKFPSDTKRNFNVNVSLSRFVEKSYPAAATERAEAAERAEKAENERKELVLDLIARMRGDGTAEAKFAVVAELSELAAVGTENQALLATLDSIPPLITMVRDGSPASKAKAADVLRYLSRIADNRVTIAREGGIPPLIALVRDGSADGKAKAASALGNVAADNDPNPNHENRIAIAREGGIPPLIALVRDGSVEGKANAACALQNIAGNNDIRVLVAREGGIPPFIALVRDGTPNEKVRGVYALRNLVRNAPDNAVLVAREGGVQPLIAFADDSLIEEEDRRWAEAILSDLASYAPNECLAAGMGRRAF